MRPGYVARVLLVGALFSTACLASRPVIAADPPALPPLEKKLPEVRFDATPLADVVEFLRDTTGANIHVNWRALEAGGIDKNAPVTTRLRDVKLSKILRTILDDVGAGTVKLGYTLDEGVITISTSEDLEKDGDELGPEIGDEIRVHLDQKHPNTEDTSVTGTLEFADVTTLRLRHRGVQTAQRADGTKYNFQVESVYWIPRSSVLYIEKRTVEKAQPATKPAGE